MATRRPWRSCHRSAQTVAYKTERPTSATPSQQRRACHARNVRSSFSQWDAVTERELRFSVEPPEEAALQASLDEALTGRRARGPPFPPALHSSPPTASFFPPPH